MCLSEILSPFRLLPATLYGKGGIAGGQLGVALPFACALVLSSISRSAVSAALQPQVIAVMQNTKSARLTSGPVPSLLSGAPSTQRA